MKEIQELSIDGMDLKFFNQKNLLIGSRGDPEPLTISGNSFIIDVGSFVYFHFFQDMIGQFLFLKDLVTDLRIIVLAETKEKYVNQSQNSTRLIEECLESFGIKEQDFLYVEDQDILLESTVWVNSIYNNFITKDKTNKLLESKDQDYLKYNIEIFKKIKNHYSYLISDYPKIDKIFVSRKIQNDQIRKSKDLLDSYRKGFSYEELVDMYPEYTKNSREVELLLGRIIEKFISLEEEELLENFFISKGYTIVTPENFSFSEQINMYNKATHIASIIGSGLHNCIFAQDSAKVFIVNINNIDRFDYDNICAVATKNIYHIPLITNATILPSTYEIPKNEIDEIIETYGGADQKLYTVNTIIEFCEKYLNHIL